MYRALRLAYIALQLACLQLAFSNSNGLPCFAHFVSFRSFWLFWRLRFACFGFVVLFGSIGHFTTKLTRLRSVLGHGLFIHTSKFCYCVDKN